MPTLSGRCHCGNLSVDLRSAREPADLGARACMCTFCRGRRLRWTSDPAGSVTITARHPADLSRYRFATATADFVFCRRCGQFAAAMTDDPEPRAVVNVDLLDAAADFPDAGHRDFDGEDPEARRTRRARNWTPARLHLGE
ncbi:MAG: hypothetical protein JNL82_34760 [Myxococcales bacterium]|nr:hypothetical protein [Myxococcales bacterium]